MSITEIITSNILLLLGIFLLAWILAQLFWKILEGILVVKIQNKRMDAAYAKLVRLLIQAKKDLKIGGSNNDNL